MRLHRLASVDGAANRRSAMRHERASCRTLQHMQSQAQPETGETDAPRNFRKKFENGQAKGTHLLDNFWGSPGGWRDRARGGEEGLTGAAQAILRGSAQRTESSASNVLLGDNKRGTHGRTGSVRVDYWGGKLRPSAPKLGIELQTSSEGVLFLDGRGLVAGEGFEPSTFGL